MKLRLWLSLYNFILLIFTLIDGIKWLIDLFNTQCGLQPLAKRKRDLGWGQKFALLPLPLPSKQAQERRYLIHCASMGEVIAAMPLIEALLAQRPEQTFVITTNTLTGKTQALQHIAKKGLEQRVFHCYLPIDLPWLTRRLLKRSQTDKLLIMEVELWPNLILSAAKLNIDVAVINGRMTTSSLRGYQKFSSLSAAMLQAINHVYVRNQGDLTNYQALGLSSPQLELIGNIKFDIALPDPHVAEHWMQKLNIADRKVMVAGSTHETEEAALLESWPKLQQQEKNVLLIIAPRHPHRFAQVTQLLEQKKMNYITSSSHTPAHADTQVILVDEMGILSQIYSVADLVFVGGSIAKKGGHNPIEASAFAKPVIMGPHIYNNPEIINALADNNGLLLVSDSSELHTACTNLLQKPELATQIGQAGLATIKAHAGVIEKLCQRL